MTTVADETPTLGAFDLTGRRVLVTGASRGIGRAMSVGLAQAGATVVCVARTAQALTETVAAGGSAAVRMHAVPMDLRGEDAAASAVEAALGLMGGLDILVNNAADDHDSALVDTELLVWQRVVQLNLESCFTLCRAAAAPLLADGGGKVINVGSVLSHVAVRDNTAYIAAKTGLLGMTRGLALEWASKGVQVNLLCPGFIRTEMTAGLWETEDGSAWVTKRTPMRRWGEPADLVGPAVFLASSASDFMTGQSLVIDGGWTVN
jgi:NAD(P)-dependent dehydrogenase (short-subunit alcohol dehydrogenase family)